MVCEVFGQCSNIPAVHKISEFPTDAREKEPWQEVSCIETVNNAAFSKHHEGREIFHHVESPGFCCRDCLDANDSGMDASFDQAGPLWYNSDDNDDAATTLFQVCP